ncbi:MAG: NAD(+) synthase [Candidatus Aegiribacteria sp.]
MGVETDYGRLAETIREWIGERVSRAGARGLVVGLSGGLDSAVSAALGAGAVGEENVLGLIMPCGSSGKDTRDGLRIADHLAVEARVIELSETLDAFLRAGGLEDTTELNSANVKARLRMTMLYAHSEARLVLGTSNYSEIRVGYWTKWGDGAADLQPLARLYKDEVRLLGETLGLPRWVIERVPSAGLWPGQSDEKEMGVTYGQIREYFQGGDIQEDAAKRIERMAAATEHKRRPVPYFDAREWMEENG